MPQTRSQKRFAADICNPLHHRGILQLVLDFVGSGQHIFLSTVSKSFTACYLNVPVLEEAYHDENGLAFVTHLTHEMTAFCAILGSRTRIHLAIELGFVLDTKSFWRQFSAGNAADIETLVQLKEMYGMPYTEYTSRGAAESGSVSTLKWLLEEHQYPQAADICMYAVFAPTLDVLKYLKQRGCVLPDEKLCTAAVRSKHAASTLQYLHAEGVPFRASTMVEAID
jgi:hypothetical protein